MSATRLAFVAILVIGCVGVPAETPTPTEQPTPAASAPVAAATSTPPTGATPITATPPITIAPPTIAPPTIAPPTASLTPAPTVTASLPSGPPQTPIWTPSPPPGTVLDHFTAVWSDPEGCTMEDSTSVVGPVGVKVFIVGWCDDGAMAWESDDGFQWRRVLSGTDGDYAYGASTDGLLSAVFVGTLEDEVPLVWEPIRGGEGFKVTELPIDEALETFGTTAIQVDRAGNSFMIVGNTYPNGPDGDSLPVAWLKILDETDWLMVEPPPDAGEFVDVAENSVFRDGTVGLAGFLGQNGFVGDRYSVLGYTNNVEPAVWTYTLDGNWEMTLLPTQSTDNALREMIDSRAVLDWQRIWTLVGEEWIETDLTEHLSSAWAGERLDYGEGNGGLMVTGIQWADGADYPYTVFLHSMDGIHWTALPDHPEYHEPDLIDSLAAMEDRVIGVSEERVYVGPIPAP